MAMEMEEITTICSHCDRTIPTPNIDLHYAHCSRNLEKCKVCGDTVPRKHAQEHSHAPDLGPTVDGSGPRYTVGRGLNASAKRQQVATSQTIRCVRVGATKYRRVFDQEEVEEPIASQERDHDDRDEEKEEWENEEEEDNKEDETIFAQDRDQDEEKPPSSDDDDYEPEILPSPLLDKQKYGPSLKKKSKKKKPITDSEWELKEGIVGGPINGDILPSFLGHIAYAFLQGQQQWDIPKCQSRYVHSNGLEKWHATMPLMAREYVDDTGLGHIYSCVHKHIDSALICAFLERWQPDTNSFHLPVGEMTILLHDVQYIMDLPIDGELLSQADNAEMDYQVMYLFEDDAKIMHDYYNNPFTRMVPWEKGIDLLRESDDKRQAQGFLAILLGCLLFTDKTGNRFKPRELVEAADLEKVGKFSWGSAALAYLYRQLGKATRIESKGVSGCLYLLQSWIYEYFPKFRPSGSIMEERSIPLAKTWRDSTRGGRDPDRILYIRRQVDELTACDVNWCPYVNMEEKIHPLSLYRGLIAYRDIIEPYMPDRCLRQFGYIQDIPQPILRPERHYRGPNPSQYIVIWPQLMLSTDWTSRYDRIFRRFGRKVVISGQTTDEYNNWFIQHGHGYIGSDTFASIVSHGSSTDEWMDVFLNMLQPAFERLHVFEFFGTMNEDMAIGYESIARAYQMEQSYRSQSSQPPSSRPGPSQPPSSFPGPSQPPSSRPGPSQPPSSRPRPSQPPASRPRLSLPPLSRLGPSQPASSRPRSPTPPSSHPRPSHPSSSRPRPGRM